MVITKKYWRFWYQNWPEEGEEEDAEISPDELEIEPNYFDQDENELEVVNGRQWSPQDCQ